MTSQAENPVIGFVWRPREITSSVVEMARQTRTRAIFDLSSIEPATAGPALLQADVSADAVDLKISPSALLQPDLEDFLDEYDISTLWVELHPILFDRDPDEYLDRIAGLSQRVTVVPIVGSADLLRHISSRRDPVAAIALKGSEASGFVSSETLFTLYSAAKELFPRGPRAPKLMVWGGLSTPEAVAAFLCTGAAGVVFESLHWLTDLVVADESVRSRIQGLRPNHTDLTGLNLGVPCRLFNKGNSNAVKQLKSFAGSLCGDEIRDEQRRFFADRIQTDSVAALESRFGREELVPLGVEAAFAHSFVRRFGSSSEQAVERFVTAIEQCCAAATAKTTAFTQSDTAREMGTKYPFIQGAMSWISDVPEFAVAVSEAGGLPTLALGLMNGPVLESKLGRLSQVMGDRPYAINVITLAENPHRDEQLAWIRQVRPRFAVIAAGEPSHAADLLADGIDVIYIAPNEDLVRLAFEAGVRTVICEGHEAGGHVGEHSTLTLAQILLDLRDREPELFEGRTIVLAGGVFNRETAFMAAMLGADAVQMGTVYLATAEIVETGALTPLYQSMILNSLPGETTVTGEGSGLRVRSLRTPKIEAVCSLERDFAAGSEDEASFRHKIEALSAGSLFIAARGLDQPGGKPVDESECMAQGQFMSGACAGALSTSRRLEQLHEELAGAPLSEGLPFLGPIRDIPARPAVEEVAGPKAAMGKDRAPRVPHTDNGVERIAITGMAAVNSLGNSPEEIWAASLAMRSGIVAVPPSRWNHEIFYHPRPRMPEKTYCKVAAFQNIEVSRKELGIPPQDFRTMTGSTKLTMWLAKQAIEQSGILDSDIPRERIAVLISQNSGEAAATLEDVIIRGCARTIASSVGKALQLSPDAQQVVEEEVKSGRIVIDDTTLLGRLNCSAGGFICNKYGFMGPSFSVSAACATALVALYSAYQMIRNGVIDAAVVGGAEELLTPMHFLEFSALGALAGLSGVDKPADRFSRPFDADRDGMVLGEGGGMIVIERESNARRRGARVHAYITSMGASNNNLGMVESSRSTQELAIRASFRDAPYGPEGVDLVECHATSTRQGDVEEVNALKSLFGSNGVTRLTSFKSQIGHTLGASGVNSLIRGIMAMTSGTFPGNLNFDTPDPEIEVEGSGLEIHREPSEWLVRNGSPRRLQVNAFGFGGSNYVVQVEEAREDRDVLLVDSGGERSPSATSSSRPDLPEGLFFFKAQTASHAYRVAALGESEEKAREAIEKSDALSNGGPMPIKRVRALARQGIHVGEEKAHASGLAFVFPGQGSHYAGMGHELYETFPVIKEWMDRAAKVADFDLLHLLFFDREEDLQKTRWQQPALFTMEYALVQYLWSLGVRPTALAGHSLGELTALCLAGVYSFEDGFRIVNKRALCMDKACVMNVDPGIMIACDTPLDKLEDLISSRPNVFITNINSLRQMVIGGGTEDVKAFGAELKEMGYRTTQLRVSMAFHSPIMKCIHDELEEFLAGIEFHAPQIPVISNTTMKPFPSDTDEIKRTVMAHLESPVHWLQNVQTLKEDYGVKVFVEVGPREILSNLIADSVDDVECIQTCFPSAEVTMYKTALAQLFATGHLQVPRVTSLASGGSSAVAVGPGAAAPVHRAVPGTGSAAPSTLESLVQREINSFVVESFGRFLRPSILAAIRREYDSSFAEENLDSLLAGLFPEAASSPNLLRPPIVEPVTVTQAEVTPAPEVVAPKSAIAERTAGEQDVTEIIIQTIMDATGYEREEVEPEMDLREDLSIRSSRLPVIMDSLEGRFKIKIELEDFMDVRTIRDIAERISEIVTRKEDKAAAAQALPEAVPVQPVVEETATGTVESIKRIVFREVPLENGSTQPLELSPLDQVIVAAAGGGTGLRKELGGIIRRDYGVTIMPMSILDEGNEEDWSVDLRDEQGSGLASDRVRELESLAGMILVVDDLLETKLQSKEEISSLLTGMFCLLKGFLESPAKKFFLVIQKTSREHGPGRLLSEGALGMLLSAVHEFGSVLFRWLYVDETANLSEAIRSALDRRYKPVQMFVRDTAVTTCEGQASLGICEQDTNLELGPGDVIVFSGGAYGIAPYLASNLAPLGCSMIFLGRTLIDPSVDFRSLLSDSREPEQIAEFVISSSQRALQGDERKREIAHIIAALEITRTLEDLRSAGVDASYVRCDVTDHERVQEAIEEVAVRYGKIDGVVHAAGMLKDSFIKQMEPKDFKAVLDVKLLGAWNLLEAVRDRGLRFFACLSSAASIQGNPGQTNYAAGNRAMSALMTMLRSQTPSVRCKAVMLPPIEGAGMADDPEIRSLMARMNASYVHVEELGALFARELMAAPADEPWVMFMRSLPDLQSARIDTTEPPVDAGQLPVAGLGFPREDFPMIDRVTRVDLLHGELEAERIFTHEKDLWINDHKPFEFLKHPLVSAIMALETFMEASRVLYPHLGVIGVRDAEFIDIVTCPPDAGREALISCRRVPSEGPEVVSEATFQTREISPTGRIVDRMSSNYRAKILLGAKGRSVDTEAYDFPSLPDELDTRPIDNKEIQRKYSEKTRMQGRYRVIESLRGTGEGLIRGEMIYRDSKDFSDTAVARYQYCPYLLEALIQLANFYMLMRNSAEERTLIPYGIGEVRFSRMCRNGERLRLEGCMQRQDREGIEWDSRALDESGTMVMVMKDLKMRWFTK